MLGLFCEKNMAIQTANLGTPPSGAGGDTFRSAAAKYNENFANNAHAASRLVGAQAGNLMEVGAFGLGNEMVQMPMPTDSNLLGSGFYYLDVNNLHSESSWLNVGDNIFVIRARFANSPKGFEIGNRPYSNEFYLRSSPSPINAQLWNPPVAIRHTGNTVTDSNGFIKAASPIVKLFLDKVELNDEAQQQEIIFEKLGVGDYLIKGSTGFAQEGWYIETPKDANGSVLFSAIYTTLESGDISVKTYKKKFDFETVSIVADLDNPVDITENRWIDLRLQELPQPEIEVTDDTEQ